MPHRHKDSNCREREAEVIATCNIIWKSTCVHIDDTASATDAVFTFKSGISRHAEIKTRRDPYKLEWYQRGNIPYRLNLKKVEGILRVYFQPLLIVRTSDLYIRWIPLAEVPYFVTDGGRKDRGDPSDLQPQANFPWEAFRKLREMPGING